MLAMGLCAASVQFSALVRAACGAKRMERAQWKSAAEG